MAPRFALPLSVAICLLAASPAAPCTPISATSITTNTTWGPTGSPMDTCYAIMNTITISGSATLTIQPGTVIKFAPGTSLIIGGATAGMLNALGTPTQPVVFTSSSGAAGGWAGLDFRDLSDFGGASSNLDYCVIQGGGSSGFQVSETNTNGVSLTHCVIQNHNGFGLNLSNARGVTSQCTFQNFNSYPVSGSLLDVAPLFGINTFVPSGSTKWNAIQVQPGTTSQSCTLTRPPASFCYYSGGGDNSITVSGSGAVLTIQDSTLFKFQGLMLLYITSGAGLQAHSVVFTSALDDTLGDTDGGGTSLGGPGQWKGLYLDGANGANCQLDNCVIRYGSAGNYEANLMIRSCEPFVTNSYVYKSAKYGIEVFGDNVAASGITGNFVWGNGWQHAYAPLLAASHLVPNNTWVANGSGRYNGFQIAVGTLTQNATLPRPRPGFSYISADGDASITVSGSGAVLTIQDSTVFKFRGLMLLYITGGAGLQAHSVVFTSSLDDTLGDTDGGGASLGGSGQWKGLYLDGANGANCQLDNCVIRYGSAGNYEANLMIRSCEPFVTNSYVYKSAKYGIEVFGDNVAASGITGNFVWGNGWQHAYAPLLAASHLVPNNTWVANGSGRYNGFQIAVGTLTQNATLPRPQPGFSYISADGDASITVSGSGAVLTIQDSTVFKFRGLMLLYITGGAGLKAHSVVFTSSLDDTLGDTDGGGASTGGAGQWKGLYFGGANGANCLLDNCVIRYGSAGNYEADLMVNNCEPSITHSYIFKSAKYGIEVFGDNVAGSGITGNFVWGNGWQHAYAPLLAASHLVPNNTWVANGSGRYNGFQIAVGTLTQSTLLPKPPPGFCYISADGDAAISVSGGTTRFAIESGTVFKFRSLMLFQITGGAIFSAKNVVFTSSLDDTIGDTDGGGASTGGAGQWKALNFGGGGSAILASLSCSIVRFAGSGGYNAGVYVTSASPSLAYCTISSCSGSGILATGSTAEPAIYGCTIRGNPWGITLTSSASATVRQCNLAGNSSGAISNQSTVLCDALDNWWGSATGPHDASSGPPDSNPSGTGANVSDYVSYRPWLGADPIPNCDLTTGVDAPMASYVVTPAEVDLTWKLVPGPGIARIYRRLETSDWKLLAEIVLVSSEVQYIDREVQPGSSYGYRLVLGGATPASPDADVWVNVPIRSQFGIRGIAPNPSLGDARVLFDLPVSAPARLQVIDVAGRLASEIDLPSLGVGRHAVSLAGGAPLAPGVYVVRLLQNGRSASARVAVVR